MKYYNEITSEVLNEFKVSEETGLSTEEVKLRLEKYGLNEFTKKEEGSLFDDIKDSLSEPMMLILLVAAIISALIGEYYDAIGIVFAVSIGIAIGIFTEGKSKKAAEALAKLTENIEVKVIRNGKVTRISKSDLVPGDIVEIETGDMIPADGRLTETFDLKVREDMLTGESEDVSKKSDVIIEVEEIESKGKIIIEDPIPAKQVNMVFCGTMVAYGKGKLVVTSIGDNTEIGKIAQELGDKDKETPLQAKLGQLGGQIAKVSSIIATFLFLFILIKLIIGNKLSINTSTGVFGFLESIEPVKTAFVICIALIVAAVPEGLPTMINMTLAITMQKMAKINALVTKKEACETIGSISVICSDKTGTLTQNRMTVEKVYLDGKYINKDEASNSYFLENCTVNSTADIELIGQEYKYIGSATECALLLYCKDKDYTEIRKKTKVITQIPFSSINKKMSSVIEKDEKVILLSKGAPEVLIKNCRYVQEGNKVIALTNEKRKLIVEDIKNLQGDAMRVLGFAYKIIDIAKKEAAITTEMVMETEIDNYDNELVFSGFVGIRDPLRLDVKEAIETAKTAGITVKMLTGDNINTAIAIGKELGLLENGMRAVEAKFIDTLSDEELIEEFKTISIVARSKPDTKMRIVTSLQISGEVVAVTGDGVNDAPALNKADVGIAMGIAGTEVSKSAADIILTDDSFSTIVKGIKWGRGIYENFQRFIQFQITVNIIAFFVAIISQIMGKEMPFTTIQLLWVNIIMDGPPALALGLEPVRNAVLKRKPVDRKASIITKTMLKSIIFNAVYISSILLIQMLFNPLGAKEAVVSESGSFAPNEMETVLFALFAFLALFNSFNCREIGLNSIIPNFFKNKIALQIISATAIAQLIFTEVFKGFFNAVSLSAVMWIKIILIASTVVIVNEIGKFILRKVYNK